VLPAVTIITFCPRKTLQHLRCSRYLKTPLISSVRKIIIVRLWMEGNYNKYNCINAAP
jgi:hypothetical protein